MPRVEARRALAAGARSRPFLPEHLQLALDSADDDHCVYVELDADGFVCAAGGGGGGARAAVRARLAPHSLAAGAELAQRADGSLELRMRRAAPPRAELLLWFAPDALAALDMPVLTLRNISAKREYVCHECGAGFEEPNPLKLHLFLRCEPPAPGRVWRLAAERLAGARRAAAAPPSPARLEALAAEWGRAADGHVCVYCGKRYSRRYGLKIHIRTHTGYRPLRCRHCARAFGDPSNLNKHVRLHARGAAAAFPCALCGRALARRRDLQRHLRAHAAPRANPTHTI